MILNHPIKDMNARTQVRGIISDVDGILTNGEIIISSTGEQHHVFHALDGFGIMNLIQSGYVFAVHISGEKTPLHNFDAKKKI